MAGPRRTAAVAFLLVEQYLEPTMSQKTLCAEHDLPQGVFTSCLAKYRRQQASAPSSAFI